MFSYIYSPISTSIRQYVAIRQFVARLISDIMYAYSYMFKNAYTMHTIMIKTGLQTHTFCSASGSTKDEEE